MQKLVVVVSKVNKEGDPVRLIAEKSLPTDGSGTPLSIRGMLLQKAEILSDGSLKTQFPRDTEPVVTEPTREIDADDMIGSMIKKTQPRNLFRARRTVGIRPLHVNMEVIAEVIKDEPLSDQDKRFVMKMGTSYPEAPKTKVARQSEFPDVFQAFFS